MEPLAATATCRELLMQAQAILAAARVATPRLDAEVLLADAMQVGRAVLYARLREPVPPGVCETFAAAVERRARREPVAYITGVREFWSLSFLVTRDVLIPRPETELLVEAVCELLRPTGAAARPACLAPSPSGHLSPPFSKAVGFRESDVSPLWKRGAREDFDSDHSEKSPSIPLFQRGRSACALPSIRSTTASSKGEVSEQSSSPRSHPLVCDVGTGSGCVAVSLAHELPHAQVVATDLSAAALDVARRNARAHGVESRIAFVCSDLFAEIDRARRFDVIVSNPPYVPDGDEIDLEAAWEPAPALRAGPAGLDVARKLLEEAPSWLRPGGWLVMEFGCGQAEALADLARSAGFGSVEIRPDLTGTPRVLTAGDAGMSMRNSEWGATPLLFPPW